MPQPPGLTEFLTEQPGLRWVPGHGASVRLEGTYLLDATHQVAGRVTVPFELAIDIPASFPGSLPVVFEIGGRIPALSEYHVNGDESLCLGSPLSLRRTLRRWPLLHEYLARTLRSYLYAVALKLDGGQEFVFGELRHGTAGKLQDLADDLQVPAGKVLSALALALLPRSEANAQPCPCDCGRNLGACDFRGRLDEIADLASEDGLRALRAEFAAMNESERSPSA